MYHPMRFGESVWNGVFVFVNVFRIEGGWRPPDDDDDDDDDDAFFSSPSKNSSSSHHAVGAQQMHDGPEKDKSFFEAEKAPPPPVLSPDMSLFFRSKSVVLSVLSGVGFWIFSQKKFVNPKYKRCSISPQKISREYPTTTTTI